jgi:hypothetical protein
MSFQAYIDAVEKKTGKIPSELLAEAQAKGFGPETKAMEIVGWLKEEYAVGHGHAMAFSHVVRNGVRISDTHVGSAGSHRDESDTLRLDGIAAR